ncbi:hypothetical protein AMECASPLE_024018 [Ameca splendens]|uniref:Uncharacterized protein n=1 Tax=Ameca splendens TaxID=208324 RepID=A0ABV0XHD3_9TELE
MLYFLTDEGGGLGLHLTSITSSAQSAQSSVHQLESACSRLGCRICASLLFYPVKKSDALYVGEALASSSTGSAFYFPLEKNLKLGLEEFSAPLFRGQRSQ